jgi:hypothetical protein
LLVGYLEGLDVDRVGYGRFVCSARGSRASVAGAAVRSSDDFTDASLD